MSDDTAEFLEAVFGQARGYAHLCLGTGPHRAGGKYKHELWTATSFDWPSERDKMLRAIGQVVAEGQSDVYVCPYLTTGKDRSKGTAVERRRVHADIDGPLDAEKVRALGGFAIASGTDGHGHAYVPLTESVPSHIHETLCRALGAFLGHADVKVSDNDVLRPPGTLNLKPIVDGRHASPVSWLVRPTGCHWTASDLARALGVDLDTAHVPVPSTGSQKVAFEEVDIDALSQPIRDAVSLVSEPPDRSKDSMRVVRACVDANLTLGQTGTVVTSRADLAQRFAEHPDDLRRSYDKAVASVAAHKALLASRFLGTSTAAMFGDDRAAGAEVVVDGTAARHIVLTAASDIVPRPVRWLWDQRIPQGELSLLAGKEAVGKSTVAYTLVADLTRGRLPGVHDGTPTTVLVCATEDSWEHTIVPRLHGAGAELTRVKRIEVADVDDEHVGIPDNLSLPRDLLGLEAAAGEAEASLLLLDPLMSRLGKQDTHRDNEVRQALEPLVHIAHRTRMSVLGIIHHRKAASTNALDMIMASKAFTAVARSVHTVVYDPDDDTRARRLLGTVKNNLGRVDLPILSFTLTEHRLSTLEGDAVSSRLVWGEEIVGSIDDLIQRADEDPDTRSVVAEAADWLEAHLASQGGTDDRKSIAAAARAAHISESSLGRARQRLRIVVGNLPVTPRRTFWTLPGTAIPAGTGAQR